MAEKQNVGGIEVTADVNLTPFEEKLQQLEDVLKPFESRSFTVTGDLKGSFFKDLDKAIQKLAAGAKAPVQLDAAKNAASQLQSQIDKINNLEAKVGSFAVEDAATKSIQTFLDTQEFAVKITKFEINETNLVTQIQTALTGKTFKLDVDIGEASGTPGKRGTAAERAASAASTGAPGRTLSPAELEKIGKQFGIDPAKLAATLAKVLGEVKPTAGGAAGASAAAKAAAVVPRVPVVEQPLGTARSLPRSAGPDTTITETGAGSTRLRPDVTAQALWAGRTWQPIRYLATSPRYGDPRGPAPRGTRAEHVPVGGGVASRFRGTGAPMGPDEPVQGPYIPGTAPAPREPVTPQLLRYDLPRQMPPQEPQRFYFGKELAKSLEQEGRGDIVAFLKSMGVEPGQKVGKEAAFQLGRLLTTERIDDAKGDALRSLYESLYHPYGRNKEETFAVGARTVNRRGAGNTLMTPTDVGVNAASSSLARQRTAATAQVDPAMRMMEGVEWNEDLANQIADLTTGRNPAVPADFQQARRLLGARWRELREAVRSTGQSWGEFRSGIENALDMLDPSEVENYTTSVGPLEKEAIEIGRLFSVLDTATERRTGHGGTRRGGRTTHTGSMLGRHEEGVVTPGWIIQDLDRAAAAFEREQFTGEAKPERLSEAEQLQRRKDALAAEKSRLISGPEPGSYALNERQRKEAALRRIAYRDIDKAVGEGKAVPLVPYPEIPKSIRATGDTEVQRRTDALAQASRMVGDEGAQRFIAETAAADAQNRKIRAARKRVVDKVVADQMAKYDEEHLPARLAKIGEIEAEMSEIDRQLKTASTEKPPIETPTEEERTSTRRRTRRREGVYARRHLRRSGVAGGVAKAGTDIRPEVELLSARGKMFQELYEGDRWKSIKALKKKEEAEVDATLATARESMGDEWGPEAAKITRRVARQEFRAEQTPEDARLLEQVDKDNLPLTATAAKSWRRTYKGVMGDYAKAAEDFDERHRTRRRRAEPAAEPTPEGTIVDLEKYRAERDAKTGRVRWHGPRGFVAQRDVPAERVAEEMRRIEIEGGGSGRAGGGGGRSGGESPSPSGGGRGPVARVHVTNFQELARLLSGTTNVGGLGNKISGDFKRIIDEAMAAGVSPVDTLKSLGIPAKEAKEIVEAEGAGAKPEGESEKKPTGPYSHRVRPKRLSYLREPRSTGIEMLPEIRVATSAQEREATKLQRLNDQAEKKLEAKNKAESDLLAGVANPRSKKYSPMSSVMQAEASAAAMAVGNEEARAATARRVANPRVRQLSPMSAVMQDEAQAEAEKIKIQDERAAKQAKVERLVHDPESRALSAESRRMRAEVKTDQIRVDNELKRAAQDRRGTGAVVPRAAQRSDVIARSILGKRFTAPRDIEVDDTVLERASRAQMQAEQAAMPERAWTTAFAQVFARATGIKTRYQQAQEEESKAYGKARETGEERVELERASKAREANRLALVEEARAMPLGSARRKEALSALRDYRVEARASAEQLEVLNKREQEEIQTAQAATQARMKAGGGIFSAAQVGALFVGAKAAMALSQAVDQAFGLAIDVGGKAVDQLRGFQATNDKVTKSLRDQIVAFHGNTEAALAQTTAMAGLSDKAAEYVGQAIAPNALATAGAAANVQASDLMRGAAYRATGTGPYMGFGAGLFEGQGGLLGGPILAEQMGGTPGLLERLTDDLSYFANQIRLSAPKGYGATSAQQIITPNVVTPGAAPAAARQAGGGESLVNTPLKDQWAFANLLGAPLKDQWPQIDANASLFATPPQDLWGLATRRGGGGTWGESLINTQLADQWREATARQGEAEQRRLTSEPLKDQWPQVAVPPSIPAAAPGVIPSAALVPGVAPEGEAALPSLPAPGRGLPPSGFRTMSAMTFGATEVRGFNPGNPDAFVKWQAAQAEYVDDLNATMARGAARMGEELGTQFKVFGTTAEAVPQDIAEAMRAGAKALGGEAPDRIEEMIAAGVGVTGKGGEALTGTEREIGKAVGTGLQQFAQGRVTPTEKQVLAISFQQYKAQLEGNRMMQKFQMDYVVPAQAALEKIMEPIPAAGAGIEQLAEEIPTKGKYPKSAKGGAAAASEIDTQISRVQQMQDDIQGTFEQNKMAVLKVIAPEDVGTANNMLNTLYGIGQEMKAITEESARMSAALSAAQYRNQRRIMVRDLQDALALAGQQADADNGRLGILQRQQVMLDRQNQALSLQAQQLSIELTQRQINFQRAVAGFAAPGVTAEERAARIAQAKIEADYAQKQLDIQKQQAKIAQKSYKLNIKIFDETVARQITDLKAGLDLLDKSYITNISLQLNEKELAALDRRRKRVAAELNTLIERGIADNNALISTAVSAAAQVSGSVSKFFTELTRMTNDYLRLVGRWYANFPYGSGGGNNSGTGTGGAKPNAAGFLGTVTSPTTMLMGEAGNETVAILSNPRQVSATPFGGGGGTTVVINITGNSVRDDRDLDLLADRIERKLNMKASLLGFRRPV